MIDYTTNVLMVSIEKIQLVKNERDFEVMLEKKKINWQRNGNIDWEKKHGLQYFF